MNNKADYSQRNRIKQVSSGMKPLFFAFINAIHSKENQIIFAVYLLFILTKT